jgi:RNA 3'-terminal phosphate cyclase
MADQVVNGLTDYQRIRAAIEAPLLTAFNSQVPPVPVYFDNITAVPPDPPKEYVRVNLTFGLMSETGISKAMKNARGALIIRCFAPLGGGPARCQELVSIAAQIINQLSETKKNASQVFVRTGAITGPDFVRERAESIEASLASYSPHFMAKISTGWQAIVPCSE